MQSFLSDISCSGLHLLITSLWECMLNLAARLSVLVTPRLHLDSETKIVHSFFRVGENSNNSQKYMLEAKNRAYPHRRGLRSLKILITFWNTRVNSITQEIIHESKTMILTWLGSMMIYIYSWAEDLCSPTVRLSFNYCMGFFFSFFSSLMYSFHLEHCSLCIVSFNPSCRIQFDSESCRV